MSRFARPTNGAAAGAHQHGAARANARRWRAATNEGAGGSGGMAGSTAPYAFVVDDDPVILMDVRAILEDAGFRSYEAGSGDEAKELLGRVAEHVTLLFSDVEMPGGTNGFALAKYVAVHWPWIEIVIASGRLTPADGDMPEKASFIAKPFDCHMVHGHLREMLPESKKPAPLKKAV